MKIRYSNPGAAKSRPPRQDLAVDHALQIVHTANDAWKKVNNLQINNYGNIFASIYDCVRKENDKL